MPEVAFVSSAIAAGALLCFGLLVMARGHSVAPVASAPAAGGSFRNRWRDGLRTTREWLAVRIARAGWDETPERLAALSVILAGVLAALGLCTVFVAEAGTAASLGLTGAVSGLAAVGIALKSAITRRRRRLTRELAPLLELFVLELGGGGSAMSALGTVTMQIEGELASELRRHLIAAQVNGSTSFAMAEQHLRAQLLLQQPERAETHARHQGCDLEPGAWHRHLCDPHTGARRPVR